MHKVYLSILFFAIYSTLGWMCETIYCSVGAKKFVNRGFLNGAVCPVYGFGALAVIALLEPFTGRPLMIYGLGIITATVVEYITSYMLEYSFNMRWWDYSRRRFNFKGRICLLNSSLFGLMVLVLMECVHPLTSQWLGYMPEWALMICAIGIVIAFSCDTVHSVVSICKINSKVIQLSAFMEDLLSEIEIRKQTFGVRRIIKAFPHMTHKKHDKQLKQLREMLLQKKK